MWIEIGVIVDYIFQACPSQPARAVWIEIKNKSIIKAEKKVSQPARAVWIEMLIRYPIAMSRLVTACEGCVD